MSHARLELLEPRTHLSVDATYANSWTTGPHLFIAVEYASEAGVDTATLGNTDLLVRRAGAGEFATELAGIQQLDGLNRVRATYRMRAPGNWWDSGDNGAYTSVVRAGEVGDLGGAAVAQSELHTNNLWFPSPFVSMVSSTVTASTWLINVRFPEFLTGSPAALGFRDGNLSITGPNGELASRLHQVQTIDGAIVATYSVAAPGGAWDTFESGRYTVRLQEGQIYLLGGTSLGHANLWFGAPRAELLDASNDGAAISVRVRYESRAAMNLASLDDADLVALAADGSEFAMVRAPELDAVDGNGLIAGYRLHGPGGLISALPAGRCQFVVRAGEVADEAGYTAAPHAVGSVGLIGTAAAATVSSAVAESAFLYANRTLFISINIRPELATMALVVGAVAADITTPHGLSVTGTITSTHRLTDGTRQIVVAMLAPDIFLNYHDSGTYSVMLREGFVYADGSTSMSSVSAGTFEFVNSNPRVEILGHRFTASDWYIDVRISDNDGINPGSFYSALPLIAASMSEGNRNYRFMLTPVPAQSDGSYLTTLRAESGGGGPDYQSSGLARIWMHNPVVDVHGNRAGHGQFASMLVHFDRPGAAITAAPNATDLHWDVAVRYTSPVGFEESAFQDGDLTATGPRGASLTSRLMSVSLESDGSWTARYVLTGEITDGMHSITLVDGRAIDLAGNSTRGRSIGSRVTVIASASSPDAWATPDALVVRVDYASAETLDESSFGLDDLIVTRGPESLIPVRIDRIRRDAFTWRVAYTFAPHGGAWSPEANGAWTASTVADAVVRIDGTSVPARTVRTMNLFFTATPRLVSSTVTDTTWLVNIRFQDAIDINSLSYGDLRIINRPDMQSSLHQLHFINGAVVATFSFTAPGGAWDYEDNGAYTIELLANAVRDAAGISLPGRTFAPVSLWFAQPAAYVADNFRTGGDWFIDAYYNGVGGMDAATLGDDDLTLERTGIAYSVTFMNWDAITRRARYRVNPVNGSWTTEDNGPYLLTVNANTVFGADGTAARARVIALLVRPLN